MKIAAKKKKMTETNQADLKPETNQQLSLDEEGERIKAKYLAYRTYREKFKVDIERRIDSMASSYHYWSDDALKAIVENYDEMPSINEYPELADAAVNEMLKRGLDKEAENLKTVLSTNEKYTKPWLRF